MKLAGLERKESPLAARLRGVLSKYLSALTVESVLVKVYSEEGIDPGRLNRVHLEQIFQSSLFSSVRLFCKPDKLPVAMMDLADLLEPLAEEEGDDSTDRVEDDGERGCRQNRAS